MNSAKRYEMFVRFRAANPKPETELEYTTPFELLIAVLLSAQATDVGVNKATRKLYPVANTPQAILDLGEEELKTYIQTIGLYKTKAKNVISTCRMLVELHGGEVPRDRESLEALPGVGRKTANVVLNTAFGEPTMAVDTHIFRVSNRTGLAPGKNVEIVEQKLLKFVPKEFLQDAHHWLILHGRYTCKARKPECWNCMQIDLCDYKQRQDASARRRLDQHQVVAVDQLRPFDIAEDRFDLARRLAHDAPRFAAGVVRQSARHRHAVLADAGDHRAAPEFALHLDHADRQQRLALASQLLHRAGVQHHLPRRVQVIGHPLLARGQVAGLRGSSVPIASPPARRVQHIVLAAPGDDRVGAGTRGALGGQDLGQHAAAAQAAAGAAGHRFERRSPAVRSRSAPPKGPCADRREQAALVGQDDQRIGFDQVGHQRAQGVVVAELDLVGDDGVVLVDDRDHAQAQQGGQRRARVQVAFAVGQVGVRQQHLRGAQWCARKLVS
jgi:endonuclease-3